MRMMELHAPLKVIQRSQGRTATAAAAYRAAARIECERTGQLHDYSKRQRGVEGTALLLPDDAPEWDRSTLWNQSEMREKHPRAQPAKEIEIAFPAEFNAEQRREAGLAIGALLRDRYRVGVDIAWHRPSRKGDQRNHHAHILYTARGFENGAWAKKKQTALDDRFGKGPDEVRGLREAMAGILNTIAARDQLGVYVEHLSFEERGLDQEATQHLGPIASQMEQRGEPSEIGDHNRAVKARNAERDELREQQASIIPFPDAKLRTRTAYERFYADTQARRQALQDELDARHAAQELAARQELEQLQLSRGQRYLFARLWYRVTGREREENQQLAQLADTLRMAAEARARALSQFESERNERLVLLKTQRQAQDLAASEWAAAEAQASSRATVTYGRPSTDAGKEARRAAYLERLQNSDAPREGVAGPQEG